MFVSDSVTSDHLLILTSLVSCRLSNISIRESSGMLTKELQEQLIKTIKQQVNPDFIILFGSFTKGSMHNKSDIDLAYFSKQPLSSYERFIFAGDLASIAHREVDLVDLRQIDTVFTMQIFEQGIPINIRNENEFTRQKMRAYSMYATLSEQQSLKRLKKRKCFRRCMM